VSVKMRSLVGWWVIAFTVMTTVLRLTGGASWGLDVELAVIAASISVVGTAAKKRNQQK
jgi:hypothetical protein